MTRNAIGKIGKGYGKRCAQRYTKRYAKYPLGRPGLSFSLALLLLHAPAFAISESQFIQKVLAQDKLLEEAQIGLDIKQIELDASRDNYANWKAELSATADYKRSDDKQIHTSRSSGALSTSPYTRTGKQTPRRIRVDISKRFLSNPGSVSLGFIRGKDSTRNTRYDRDFDKNCGTPREDEGDTCQLKAEFKNEQNWNGYTSEYYAQITYPLLKHDGNAETLKTYRRNIIDLEDQQLSFFETKENFLSERLEDYLSWVLSRHEANINEELLDSLLGLQPREEADAAFLKSIVLQTENFKRDAEIQTQAIKERLSVLLDDVGILHETPEYDLRKRITLVPNNLRDYLRKHNRALQRITLDMRLNEIEIAFRKNRLLPSFDLTLRAGKEYDKVGTATQNYADDTTRYDASLEFVYPLGGSITDKAELAKRALSTRRLNIAYAERMERIEAELQRLATLLNLDEARLLNAIDAARQSARIQRQNYDNNQSSFRDLVQAYRDERVARLDHIDNLIDYHTNSIEYDNLLDRIIKSPCPASLPECA